LPRSTSRPQLLKSFVGTGVLFLGKAFENGGLGFSTIVLLGIASLSLYSFLLLIKTRLIVPHSFGGAAHVQIGKTWH
jgi:proton-coupled amino acid transporter